MSPSSLPVPDYYSFGQKSAALLALLLTSDGQGTALAYRRPAGYEKMTRLYTSAPLAVAPGGSLAFTLALAPDKDGLLSMEPRGWPVPYELHRAHFLGTFNPFGTDEIPFQDFGGINRRRDIPVNRVFSGVFRFNPSAPVLADRATLTLVDVESGGQSEEKVSISALDDDAQGIPGGLFVALRVNWANYADACASLALTDGQAFTVPVAGQPRVLSRLVLNTSADPV